MSWMCVMELSQAATLLFDIKQNINKVIVGKNETVELLLTALCRGGHVLLEDVPGTGKTMLAKSLACSLDGAFHRIQFTPDLLPSDVMGLNYYNQKAGEFVSRPGPVFGNILHRAKHTRFSTFVGMIFKPLYVLQKRNRKGTRRCL